MNAIRFMTQDNQNYLTSKTLQPEPQSRARVEISPGIYQYDLRTIADWFNIARDAANQTALSTGTPSDLSSR